LLYRGIAAVGGECVKVRRGRGIKRAIWGDRGLGNNGAVQTRGGIDKDEKQETRGEEKRVLTKAKDGWGGGLKKN